MQHLQPNSTLQGGKYKIKKVLGQGGFGITYLASQSVSIEGPLGKINAEIKVTIKEFFMKDLCNRDETTSAVSVPSTGSTELVNKFRQKFIKEAQNISKLNHPNIIKVLDVFEENGTAYYVMEYIDGGSLNDLINRKGKLDEMEALCYTKMIAEALQYIHSMNMNHLDVKPANVLLRKNGEAVLIDFGLSKNYATTGEQTTSTPVGISVGYAPIEQSRIGGVGMFSPATDVYSLGATLFKMLTGDVPPEASVVMDDGLPDMKNVSSNIVKAIEKAMEPRRKSRYQSIDEFMAALGDSSTEVKRPIVAPQQSEETQIIMPQETPKFLKEEDKEATKFISDIMVVNSLISTDDVVDLGLSVKWCSHNVGCSKPEESGDYYSWKERYDWQLDNSNLEIPTRKQFKELIDRCRWSWVTLNGVNGCKVTGPSGKSIFLPATGKSGINGVTRNNLFGYYWTSSQAPSYNMAYYLNFDSHDSDLNYEPYATGRNIRLVCK